VADIADINMTTSSDDKHPPVVLQLLPSLVTGGVERGTVDVARTLAEEGWHSLVVSAGGPMVRELTRAGVNHIEMPAESKNPLVMHANVDKLARIIRDYHVDIVHARSRAPAWSALAACWRTDTSFVTTFHGTYDTSLPFKRTYNSVMARGQRVIAISDFIARHLVDKYSTSPDRITVIHRGVDFELFDPQKINPERLVRHSQEWRLVDGVPVIMLPGRLTDWKGQRVLLAALAKLPNRNFRCLLVGDDQGRTGYRRELERLIEKFELQSVVQLVGNCTDMPAAYMLADVVVSASTKPEAFGRVIVEAQAMGKSVIATDHGAPPELVLLGKTGFLVPPADPAALAAQLEHVLALGSSERETLAREVRSHVRGRFSKETMCSATLDVYRRVLTEKERNGSVVA
jgi:glycosyltransferase involved in cell wall biosynthesis